MTLSAPPGAVNSIELTHAVDIDCITSIAEVQGHLARHDDGTLPLRPWQLTGLRHRLRDLEAAERIAAAQPTQPVVHHPAPAPAPSTRPGRTRKRQPTRRPTEQPPDRPARYSTDRMSDAERAAGLDVWYSYVESGRCKLSPTARATWLYLWWYADVSHHVRTTHTVIGRMIGRKHDTGRLALLELIAARLAEHPTPGSHLARTLDDALGVVIVHLPTPAH